jgi:ribose transport system permease protein
MNHKNQGAVKQFLNIRGMRGALTAFAGLIIIYIAFGAINPTVFSGQNVIICSVPCQNT